MVTDDDAVVLGEAEGQLLLHRGDQHTLLVAPTRSGKGISTVIPTLLNLKCSSIVCYDIKGENWLRTAGAMQRYATPLYFNPTSARSVHFNPLYEIRKGVNEVRDTQNISDVLVDPEGSQERRDHWATTAHGFLVGGILHVLYAEPDKTLAGVARFFSDPKRPIEETLSVMARTCHLPSGPHPVVAQAAREMTNRSPNERSGVLSTTLSFLQLYRDPLVQAVTATSDFELRDLQHATRPVALYLVVPPSDISRTKGLIRLILNQMGRRLTEDLSPGGRHPLLLVLDEFPSLGHLDFFESSLAFLAGYKIRGLLVAQSLNQLDKIYGQHNAIVDNCHTRVVYATNDDRTAKRISDLLGTATETRAQESTSGGRFSLLYHQGSRTEVVSSRQLMTPGEIMQMDAAKALILTASAPPILADKLRYYDDPRFMGLVLPPPPQTLAVPLCLPSPWCFEGPKPLLLKELAA